MQAGVPKPPYLVRFFSKVIGEVSHFMTSQQVIVALLLSVGAVVYQHLTGRLKLEAFRENLWSVACPFVWLVCGFGAFYVIKAAIHLDRELVAERESGRPELYIPSEYTRIPDRPSRIPAFLTVSVSIGVIAVLAYLSFHAAFPLRSRESANEAKQSIQQERADGPATRIPSGRQPEPTTTPPAARREPANATIPSAPEIGPGASPASLGDIAEFASGIAMVGSIAESQTGTAFWVHTKGYAATCTDAIYAGSGKPQTLKVTLTMPVHAGRGIEISGTALTVGSWILARDGDGLAIIGVDLDMGGGMKLLGQSQNPYSEYLNQKIAKW